MSARPSSAGCRPWSSRCSRRLADSLARELICARDTPYGDFDRRRLGRSSATQAFSASRSHGCVMWEKSRTPACPATAKSHTVRFCSSSHVVPARRASFCKFVKSRRGVTDSPTPLTSARDAASRERAWRTTSSQ